MKLKAVVFDFDGTLVASNQIKREMFFSFVRTDPYGPERINRLIAGLSDRYTIWDAYVRERDGPNYSKATVDQLIDKFNLSVNHAIGQAPEAPGATPLLERLKNFGLHLAVSSATPINDLKIVLDKRDWKKYFDTVSGFPSGKLQTLEGLCEKLELTTKEIAVVGDGEDDRSSAKAIGCGFYPVGEGRGGALDEKKYTLFELCELFAEHGDVK